MLLPVLISLALMGTAGKTPVAPPLAGKVKISFVHKVKDSKLILHDTAYTNPFGETYTVRKFKYYVSHLFIKGSKLQKDKEPYHLVDESKPETLSFEFTAAPGYYNNINFLLGVDSLKNVSGAQSGALDPLNDMFWTWNTGYIMAKLEATSPQSTMYNHKVEYHIGGFAGDNSVLKNITLASPFKILQGKTTEIIIEADLDKWWGPTPIRISDNATCMTPGAFAKLIAGNYATMFTIKNIRTQ